MQHEPALDVGETLKSAWGHFTEHWALLLGAGFTVHALLIAYIAGLMLFVTAVWGLSLFSAPSAGEMAFIVVASIGVIALSSWLQLGFIAICLRINRGQEATLRTLFGQHRALMRGIAASFVFSILAGALVNATYAVPLVGDLVLTLIGALAALFSSFAYFFIVDRDRAALNAIGASFKTVWSGGAQVGLLFCCCVLIGAVAAAIPLVGPMIGWSLVTLAYSQAYLRLSR